MSATGRGAERDALDRYYTPDDLASAIVRHIVAPHLTPGDVVIEPSAGGGSFVRALQAAEARVLAIDIDPDAPALHDGDADWTMRGDWSEVAHRPSGAVAVVGNPPYRGWEAHAEAAIQCAPVVAMLLRSAATSGGERAEWWAAHPHAEKWELSERPSFTGGGTDSSDYCVIVWLRGRTGPATSRMLSWRECRKRRHVEPLGVVL